MDPEVIPGVSESPASGIRSILGWISRHCVSHILCSCPSFEGGPCWYNLLWIWDYKNMIIFGKVFQMLGELLQSKPALQNDLIQNASNS